MPVGTEVGLGPGDTVLERGTAAPHFSAHVYCGQMAGWIKMPLGIVVSIARVDIVLDGDPAPPRKGAWGTAAPTFRPMSIVAKRSPISAAAELLLRHLLWSYHLVLKTL